MLRVLLILNLLVLSAAESAEGFDPFMGRVTAPEEGQGGLEVGYREALIQVLSKLSGSPQQVAELAASGQLGPVGPLVQVHRFVAAPAGSVQRQLEVQFDQTLTNDRIRDLGLPVWPLERPETLVWVALEREGQRLLLGLAEEDQPAQQAMTEAARSSGIPLILPLLDLNDQQQVRVSDVWGGFTDNLARSTERYGAQQLLMGRSYQVAGGWKTRWLLNGIGRSQRWESDGDTLDQSLAAGVRRLAAAMASEARIRPDEISGRRLRVRIHGVNQSSDYGRLLRYLNSLSVVDRVDPVSVFGSHLDFDLASSAGLRGFQQALLAGSVLTPRPGASSAADLELDLRD